MDSDVEKDDEALNEEMSLEEIEAAYLLALETAEAAEALLPQSIGEDDSHDVKEYLSNTHVETLEEGDFTGKARSDHNEAATADKLDDDPLQSHVNEDHLTMSQVIEGLLFVGGNPLPAKRIVDVLGGTTHHEQIDELIEQINHQYTAENRPYVIQLIEGGYKMTLEAKHEPVRRRVYGQGPKDVKLSQETLEVLAFVAYKQPVNRKDVEETGKKNAGGLLRQLLRRQLIALERNEDSDGESYHTTKRFLDLFGLSSIGDLPQAVDFEFK